MKNEGQATASHGSGGGPAVFRENPVNLGVNGAFEVIWAIKISGIFGEFWHSLTPRLFHVSTHSLCNKVGPSDVADKRARWRWTISVKNTRRLSQVLSTQLTDDGPVYHAMRPPFSS